MAGLTVETKLRPCYVVVDGNTQKALFHCWSFFSHVISPSPMIGGHPGGVIANTYGIVELEDGSVQLILPKDISFVSGIFDEYVWDEEKEDSNPANCGHDECIHKYCGWHPNYDPNAKVPEKYGCWTQSDKDCTYCHRYMDR